MRTTWLGLKKDQKFKVIKNTNSHNYPLNTIYTMTRSGIDVSNMDNIATEYARGNTLRFQDIELVYTSLIEIKQKVADITTEYNAQFKELTTVIEFCEKYNTNDYNPMFITKFKSIVTILNDNTSLYDKSVNINNIINE